MSSELPFHMCSLSFAQTH